MGKVKGVGVPARFLLGLDFRVRISSSYPLVDCVSLYILYTYAKPVGVLGIA